MLRTLGSRLFSAGLILLFSTGGGSLPLLDGLLFHSRDRGVEVLRPHYEATSGCHADGCAVRSTAQQTRFAPVSPAVAKADLSPERSDAAPSLPAPLSRLLSGQPLSRAPPLFG